MAGLTSSVTESNYSGWSGHKFLSGQVMAGSHCSKPIVPLAKANLYLKQSCLLFLRS